MGLPGVYFNSGPVHKEGVYSWVFLAWHGYPKKIFILERLFTHLLCSRHSADHGDYRVPVTLPFLSWAASDWVPSSWEFIAILEYSVYGSPVLQIFMDLILIWDRHTHIFKGTLERSSDISSGISCGPKM